MRLASIRSRSTISVNTLLFSPDYVSSFLRDPPSGTLYRLLHTCIPANEHIWLHLHVTGDQISLSLSPPPFYFFFQTPPQSEKNTRRENLMPTLGALLKKKKTHSTGSKELPSSPTVAESSSTQPSDTPADTEHPNRTADKESSDNAVNTNTNTTTSTSNNNSKSNSGVLPDTQMNSTTLTNQQSAQGANNNSHHHHHLPNIGSIKSIINHPQNHGATEGSANANFVQTSQGQLPKSQPRQTKGKYSLEDFSLQRTLGTGSFGRVHLVQSRHNHRFYAIKVLKKAQVVKMKQVEHTNDERRMLQRVKHPFLITLWGTFQDSKNLYMVMDFVEGGELFSLLRKSQVWMLINQPLSLSCLLLTACANCLHSDSPIRLLNFMPQKSHWLWNICMRSILYIETLSPKTCCWTGMGI